MKGALAISAAVSLTASAFAAETPVRNPFCPIGREGRLEVISADYHLTRARELAAAAEEAKRKAAEEAARKAAEEAEKARLEAEKASAAAAAAKNASAKPSAPVVRDPNQPATDAEWSSALKQIRIGGRTSVLVGGVTRTCVMLDGKAYGEGDVKTVVSGGRAYSWRVAGLDGENAKLKLERLRDRAVNQDKGGKQ